MHLLAASGRLLRSDARGVLAVIGAGGFIGSSIRKAASASGTPCLSIVRSARRVVDGSRETYAVADSRESLTAHFARHDLSAICLAAGRASVADGELRPWLDASSVFQPIYDVLMALRDTGQRPRVGLVSSAAVYGQPSVLPIGEDSSTLPLSIYGANRLLAENMVRELGAHLDIDVCVFRVFSVFGGAQRRLLPYEIWQQLRSPESRCVLRGTGAESRDFLHVDDLASAVTGVLMSSSARQPTVVNIASGRETTVRDLVDVLRDLVAPTATIEYLNTPSSEDPIRWVADIRRLATVLPGWQPASLRQGLERTVAEWELQPVQAPS